MSIDNIRNTAHWRDSARQVKFLIVDYRACFALLLFIFVPSYNLALAVLLFFAFLFIIERYGYTLTVFSRILIGFLGGKYKTAIPWWRLPTVDRLR